MENRFGTFTKNDSAYGPTFTERVSDPGNELINEHNGHVADTDLHVTATKQGEWNGKIDKSIFDAAGDLIYGSADNTPARLAKGIDGQVLTLASGLPSWANGTIIVSGSYIGDGSTTDRLIPVGFNPKQIMVVGNSNETQSGAGWSVAGTSFGVGKMYSGAGMQKFSQSGGTSNAFVPRCSTGGFLVRAEASYIGLNNSGQTYYYTAIG